MNESIEISVVLPLFNEEKNVSPMYTALHQVLQSLKMSYEIIFVDDGSKDQSVLEIQKIRKNDSHVKYISFSRNFGHQSALLAGMDHSTGKCVITMDSDMQHPVSLIPQMIDEWKKGSKVVLTERNKTEGAGFFKNLSSQLYYKILGSLVSTDIHERAADFRLLDREVVLSLSSMKEKTKFLRGLVSWVGYKQSILSFTAQERFSGKTKYTLKKMLRFALEGIVSFSSKPLYLSMFLGSLMCLAGFVYALFILYVYFTGKFVVPGWTSTTLAILLIGGVQLLCLGIIGVYIGKIYEEVKGRPPYLIQKKELE